MVKRILILFVILDGVAAGAQNRVNIWELGHNNFGTLFPAQEINFNSGLVDASTVYRSLSFQNTNASICDTSGQLLFYTNGVYIANRNHDSLDNSANLNPGYWTDFYAEGGMGIPQGALILNKPGSQSNYGVFYVTGEYGDFYGKTYMPFHLSYSEVNMNLDGGLGGIVSEKKNIHVIEDSIMWGRITACKHANSRDWWVVTHKFYSDKYYQLLVTPDTILTTEQIIGNKFISYDPNGMAVFSPDGSQYAHLNINDTIDLLQFNRCTGEFSDPVYLTVPDTPILLSATLGCSFSPNSRFLYVSSYRQLWQFDTWASDINGSKIFIDSIDIYNSLNWLFLHQLAPDGKIYISTFNSDGLEPILHIIDQPDSLGIACKFIKNGLPLPPITTNTSIPNFPNYYLGSLPGSPCDTLFNTISAAEQGIESLRLKILPNPNDGNFTIQYHLPQQQEGEIEIVNLYGETVASFKRPMWSSILNVAIPYLTKGLYLVKLSSAEKTISSKMIVE